MTKQNTVIILLVFATATCTGQTFRRSSALREKYSVNKKASPAKSAPSKNTSLARRKPFKRKGLQGYRKYHTFSQMSYEELCEALQRAKDAKNGDICCKYLDRMITMCDDINSKARHIIELADILYAQQRYDDAAKWYTEFTHLYPGNQQIEYASYRAIVCSSKKILSCDRDQSPTEKTLELANDFLKRTDVFTKYQKQVKTIQQECYQTLAQSDCNIAAFYLKNGSYHAAEQRLKFIRTEWLEKVPAVVPTVAHLEVELATVFSDFKAPESSIKLAQVSSSSKKTSMIDRF